MKYRFTFTLVIIFMGFSEIYSQIFEAKRINPYHQVFVDTDDFDDTYLDTLALYIHQTEIDSIKFKINNDLAYYWHTRNLTTAFDLAIEGLSQTQKRNDQYWYARHQATLGSILLRQEKLDSAFTVLNSAIKEVKEKDLPFIYTQIGYVYERRGELDKAADFALKTLELGERLDDLHAQAIAYSDLSNLFWKQSKFKEGLEFGLKSLELFEKRNIIDLDYDFTLYVVGNNYLDLNQPNKALEYYNRSKTIGEQYGFYNNLSDVYISLTDLYTHLENYTEAESSGRKALEYAELLDNAFMVMRSWLSLGKLSNSSGDFSDAVKSFENSIEIATENFGDEYYLSQAYKGLSEAHYNKMEYDLAFLALRKHDSLKEIIFTAEADQRISLLQTEFEVAQKEDTIALQIAKIDQQNTRQTLVTFVSFLLLVLIIVLVIFFRKNSIKNKLLQKQNKEKEFLLKEIHHRVKNNLEVVSSLLALQSVHISDKGARSVMQDSQNRVHSMSMIHQRLYQGEDLTTIEMKEYFTILGEHILDSFSAQHRINLVCNMKTLELDVDTAIPIGLIVNELFTNTMKYAFPDESKGEIVLGLKRIDKGLLKLNFKDTGVGVTENTTNGTGFGSQLIDLLVKQLNGTMETNVIEGMAYEFIFDLSIKKGPN